MNMTVSMGGAVGGLGRPETRRGWRRLGWEHALFSESVLDTLVRPGGRRRLSRFARRTRASNVAFRGITPDPATAIQAVTGSGVEAGQVEGDRSII
jgi:hypothetical protein